MKPLVLFTLLWAAPALAQSGVARTRHNLSVTGPGEIRAETETQICVFCHVGHGGQGLGQNRPVSSAAYASYESSTLRSRAPRGPSGATRVCLSCHDGTIAPGELASARERVAMRGTAGGMLPPGASNLGTDLRRSHPVSFAPGSAQDLREPPHDDPVKLDGRGQLQCTSCHDPHEDRRDQVQGMFLVKPNRGSALCLTCHAMPEWAANPSAHQASTAFFDASLGARTAYSTVADNGCESCHRPHGAQSAARLLRQDGSQTCLGCHDGRVAKKDVASDFARPYAHPVLGAGPQLHDAAEGPDHPVFRLPNVGGPGRRHAQCVDCHDPHASFDRKSEAPRAGGTLAGVWGIDRNGNRVRPVQYEYEVCFKCHADSLDQPGARGLQPPERVRRAAPDVNLRRVFDLGAASFHPVEGPGRNPDVPGLRAPFTATSAVYCSDCHESERAANGEGPSGPHGSSFPHILGRAYATTDLTPESPAAYALCYACHDRDVLLSERSGFPLHATHVQKDAAPCSACHDPHGVSTVEGNAVNNAHLVNFDLGIVRPNARGRLTYTSDGARHGSCTLACHDHKHEASRY